MLIQEEYLTSYYWQTHQTHVDAIDKYDPTKPYYEQYKLDFDQFKTLFLAFSPWATGNFAEVLALRTFRVSRTIIRVGFRRSYILSHNMLIGSPSLNM